MIQDNFTGLRGMMQADGVVVEIAPGMTRIMTWRELETAMRILKACTNAEGIMDGMPELNFSRCAKEHWGETACMLQVMRHETSSVRK